MNMLSHCGRLFSRDRKKFHLHIHHVELDLWLLDLESCSHFGFVIPNIPKKG